MSTFLENSGALTPLSLCEGGASTALEWVPGRPSSTVASQPCDSWYGLRPAGLNLGLGPRGGVGPCPALSAAHL